MSKLRTKITNPKSTSKKMEATPTKKDQAAATRVSAYKIADMLRQAEDGDFGVAVSKSLTSTLEDLYEQGDEEAQVVQAFKDVYETVKNCIRYTQPLLKLRNSSRGATTTFYLENTRQWRKQL